MTINWAQDAAEEIYSHCYGDFDECGSKDHTEVFKSIIERHCPFKQGSTYQLVPNTFFDDSKPCTCGGFGDGLHSRSCAKKDTTVMDTQEVRLILLTRIEKWKNEAQDHIQRKDPKTSIPAFGGVILQCAMELMEDLKEIRKDG